ncbi:MAG: damage-control phosphatase ARMT1 family protein [Anaerolineaceae bacterium]|nr:damage-control phosphatase ARMT1 family protein [Anaerolineaceae bacterium]
MDLRPNPFHFAVPRINPIRTDSSNPFAQRTIRERLPAILRETRELNPDYPPQIHDAIRRLHDELVADAPVRLIETPAPDYDDWRHAWLPFRASTWQRCQWFFAEVYTYRLLMEAARWWETGRDPFTPKKAEEYASEAHWQLLARALDVVGSLEERLATLLELTVRGNRIDLSYAVASSHGSELDVDDLLVDERARYVEHLLRERGEFHIIADNAGSELTMDLVLAAMLLTENIASRVVLHLKQHPTFVSDAIVADALNFLDLLGQRSQDRDAQRLGAQLTTCLETGRLRLAPDPWWNSSNFLYALPPRLQIPFAGARLTLIKGDANYRRMVYDTIWPAETPLQAIAGHFPCPLLAPRTLKSDPVVGLPPGLAERLDGIDVDWRVNGKRAVLQGTLQPQSESASNSRQGMNRSR